LFASVRGKWKQKASRESRPARTQREKATNRRSAEIIRRRERRRTGTGKSGARKIAGRGEARLRKVGLAMRYLTHAKTSLVHFLG